MTESTDDLGLANERTALAWQRTALSLAAAAAVLGRLTFVRLHWVAVVLLGFAIVLCIWVFAEARGKYAQRPGVPRRGRPRGGRAAFALCIATCLIVVTEIAALVA